MQLNCTKQGVYVTGTINYRLTTGCIQGKWDQNNGSYGYETDKTMYHELCS